MRASMVIALSLCTAVALGSRRKKGSGPNAVKKTNNVIRGQKSFIEGSSFVVPDGEFTSINQTRIDELFTTIYQMPPPTKVFEGSPPATTVCPGYEIFSRISVIYHFSTMTCSVDAWVKEPIGGEAFGHFKVDGYLNETQSNSTSYWRHDCHFTAGGHRFVAAIAGLTYRVISESPPFMVYPEGAEYCFRGEAPNFPFHQYGVPLPSGSPDRSFALWMLGLTIDEDQSTNAYNFLMLSLMDRGTVAPIAVKHNMVSTNLGQPANNFVGNFKIVQQDDGRFLIEGAAIFEGQDNGLKLVTNFAFQQAVEGCFTNGRLSLKPCASTSVADGGYRVVTYIFTGFEMVHGDDGSRKPLAYTIMITKNTPFFGLLGGTAGNDDWAVSTISGMPGTNDDWSAGVYFFHRIEGSQGKSGNVVVSNGLKKANAIERQQIKRNKQARAGRMKNKKLKKRMRKERKRNKQNSSKDSGDCG